MSDSNNLSLTILTPERRLLQGEAVDEITLTGAEGTIQILPGHAAMISQLMTGPFSVVEKSAGRPAIQGVITTGFVEVTPRGSGTEVVVVAETLDLAEEIDLERARVAQRRAEEALSGANLEEGHFEKYQLKLQRALIRQQVAAR